MNNSRFIVAVALGLSLAVVGCKDSPQRQAEKLVLDAVDLAERLCDRAESMLADALFKVDNEFAPLFKPRGDTSTVAGITIGQEMVDQLNPKALADFDKARKALAGVVRETGAPNSALTLANEALARVRWLQGACHEHHANVLRTGIARTVGQIRRKVAVAWAHLGVQNNIDDLIGSDKQVTERVQKRLDEVKAEIGDLEDKITAQQAEAKTQASLRLKLLASHATLRGEQRQLEQKEALAKGKEKIAFIRQVEDKGIEADKVLLNVKAAEAAIAEFKAAGIRLANTVELAKARQKMIEAFAGERKATGDSHSTIRNTEDTLLGNILTQITDSLKAAEKDWGDLARLERAAHDCYADAARFLDKAQNSEDRGRRGASLPAKEGHAWMANARIDIASLHQQQTNAALAGTIEELWREVGRRKRIGRGAPAGQGSPPAEVEAALDKIKVLSSLDSKAGPGQDAKAVSPADRKQAAAGKYALAQRAFRDAIQRGRAPLMWVDRGHLANALYMQALYSGTPDSLKDAQVEIEAALADKRESPHVGALLDVERKLAFGADAFLTVNAIDANGNMVLADGTANGSFFRELNNGRTTKDTPGAVFVIGKDIQDSSGKVRHEAGKILLLVARGQYMSPPEGLKLTIPADMTILGRPYKADTKVEVPSDAKMPGGM